MEKVTRYFLKARWRTDWDEVSKEQYVIAERSQYFRNVGRAGEPATSNFAGEYGVVEGRTRWTEPGAEVML